MYRAVVLTTLVLLLLAVAGLSVAQEGRIFVGGSNREDPPESTMPEQTSFEATGSEDTTTGPPPSASSEMDARQDVPASTVVTEPTPKKRTTMPPGKEAPAPAMHDLGKPEHVGKAPELGRSRDVVVPHGNGGPGGRRQEEVHGRGPKPSGKTMGAEEARNGKGGAGGRDKVVLCHKHKTLTVGAPAQAAHLRHGDSLGACR
jgi:hypothetical protein